MNKFFGLVALALFLSGCRDEYSYQYLTTHPKILEQVLAHCQALAITESSHDMNCIYAENARQEVSRFINEITSNLQDFGQKIISAQIKLADLKSQYQQKPSPSLFAAIQAQEDYIARLLAITDYIGE